MHNRRYPLDLSSAMATCDGNYIRILKLLPDFRLGQARHFNLPAPGAAPAAGSEAHCVELEVTERFRYTSSIRLQLRVAGAHSHYFRPPQLQVRLYHDACTAEVVSYQQQGAFHVSPLPGDGPEFAPDEKQQVNALLAEWLTLCLQQGMGGNRGAAEDPAAALAPAP